MMGTMVTIIQEKMESQGKKPAKRVDMRINTDSQGRIFVMNKFDGFIRILAP